MELKLQRFTNDAVKNVLNESFEISWRIVYKPNLDLRHILTELFCTRRKKKVKETDTDALLQSHLTAL